MRNCRAIAHQITSLMPFHISVLMRRGEVKGLKNMQKNKKVSTTKIGGGADYAKVKDRLIQFREDNPRSDIVTSYEIIDEIVVFKAMAIKDKENEFSASATGHAMGKMTMVKGFEKTESIAVGRSLALLGYGADGEIASSEEMEEFQHYTQEKKRDEINEALEKLVLCESLEDLKNIFSSLGAIMQEQQVIDKKNELKLILK